MTIDITINLINLQTVSQGIDGVLLTWINNTEGCLTYAGSDVTQIWRASTNDRSQASLLAEVEGNSYIDTGFDTRQTFYYWVRAKNVSGELGPWEPSDSASGIAGEPTSSNDDLFTKTPADPTGLVATNGENVVSLSWNEPSSPVRNFEIFWATTGSAAPSSPQKTISGTSIEITSANLSAGTTYDFWIKASNGSSLKSSLAGPEQGTPQAPASGGSGTVLDDTTPPSEPSSLVATASFRNIFLEWDDPSDNDLAGVEVHVATSNDRSLASLIGKAKGGSNTPSVFVHSGLSSGDTRYYWLRAFDYAGNLSGFFPSSATGGVSATTAQVTAPDLADSAVIFDKINDGAVDTQKLANLAITAQKIKDGEIDVGGNKITGQLASVNLANASVDTIKLANLSVEASKLASNSVESTKIANAAVGTAAIANAAITNAKIGNAAVDTAEIQNAAIQSAQIDTAAVGEAAIANAAITTAKIKNGDITNAKIANAAIDTAQIASLAVTDAKIDTLSADKILGGTVLAGNIKVGSSFGDSLSNVENNASDGATFTSSDAGSLATKNTVDNSDITSIDGGKITTGTIDANRITAAERLLVGTTSSLPNLGEFLVEGSAVFQDDVNVGGATTVQRFTSVLKSTFLGDVTLDDAVTFNGTISGISASDVGAEPTGGELDAFSGGSITVSGNFISGNGTPLVVLSGGATWPVILEDTRVQGDLRVGGFLQHDSESTPPTPGTSKARVWFDGSNLKIKFDNGSVKTIISK